MKGGGQKHALKRTMRSFVDYLVKTKISFEISRCIRNKLNCCKLSYLGFNATFSWYLQLQDYMGSFTVKIYGKCISKLVHTLPIVLGTDNEKLSLYNKILIKLFLQLKSSDIHAIGEVFKKKYAKSIKIKDGRGFILVNCNSFTKKAKYLDCKCQSRSYSTRNNKSKTVIVQLQEKFPRDFEILIKHWNSCKNKPDRIFYDLKGYLKLDNI